MNMRNIHAYKPDEEDKKRAMEGREDDTEPSQKKSNYHEGGGQGSTDTRAEKKRTGDSDMGEKMAKVMRTGGESTGKIAEQMDIDGIGEEDWQMQNGKIR